MNYINLLYSIVKILVRAARRFFFRKISVTNLAALKTKGPLLLVCNHPNSFLDAIVLGGLFTEPIHFLARGDAFNNPFVRKVLTSLQLIPIYRLSEGRSSLALNDATFERCHQVLLNKGIVLIFAEGLCVNQWVLRPLKKGAARIAFAAWKDASISGQFSVLPVSLNYNSFTNFGKRLLISFGKTITKEEVASGVTEGEGIHQFNTRISESLQAGLLQPVNETGIVQMLISNHTLVKQNHPSLIQSLKIKQGFAIGNGLQNIIAPLKPPYLLTVSPLQLVVQILGMVLLFIPAMAGLMFNAPLYLPVKNFVQTKTKGTVFFDSVMFGLLMILYPVYWLLLSLLFLCVPCNNYIKIAVVLMPAFAYAFLIWGDCLQRVLHYFSINSNGRLIIQQLFS